MGWSRIAGLAGIAAVVALVVNVVATAEGPRPDKPAAEEAARVVADAGALRMSALLILVEAILLLVFFGLLAVAVRRVRGDELAALVALFAVGSVTVRVVSAGALAVAPGLALDDLDPGLVIAMGDLHSATLIASVALSGALMLLVASTWRSVVPLWSAAVAGIVGAGGLLAGLLVAVDDYDFGGGPGTLGLVVSFLGQPLWILATSVWLLTRDRWPAEVPARA